MTLRRLALPLLASIVVTCGCTVASDDSPGGSNSGGSPALTVTPAPLLPATVEALPSMSVEEFHLLLTQLDGSPVVVNVWASWCGPCKTEAPMLAAAATEHPGVQFIGIDTEDSRDGAERFIEGYGVPFPSVFDPDGAIQTDLDVIGPPMTVFFDADGNEVAKAAGELSQDTLDEHLAAITE